VFGSKKKKAAKAAAAAASGPMPGDGWGIRDPAIKPQGGKCKGEIEIQPYRKAIKGSATNYLKDDRAYFEGQLKKLQQGYVSVNIVDDFNLGKTLGTGSFGRVLMVNPTGVTHGQTDQRSTYMALKIIAKERVIKTRQLDHTIAEKNILFSMDNRFLVKMFDYFVDKKSIFMLLEFINGGEMFTHIQKQKRRRFSPEVTNHFAAQTVLAFEYMHNLDIIFRDLKPENMLITSDGHIKVTDFGFAKRVDDKTWTMCGTPEYLAPEIIVNKGYNHAVDWWAVGVLIFEMRCGRSPFEARSQLEMFKKISKRDFAFPRDFIKTEQDLIGGLLMVDLTRRLGNMHGGVDEIKRQPYFAGVDFEAMRSGLVPSPYTGCRVSGPNDTSQFDDYDEERNAPWSPGQDKYGEQFNGF